MRLPFILICALMLPVTSVRGELSARIALPKQLSVESLPAFSARSSDGEQLFQKRHLEKMVAQDPKITRVALVYFATWCGPCAFGARQLGLAKETLKKNGVLTVFVNVGETDAATVHKWIRDYGGLGFPLIMDTKSQMIDQYGLLGANGRVVMPRTLVLNKKLKPLFLIGTEGDDFPEILWKLAVE